MKFTVGGLSTFEVHANSMLNNKPSWTWTVKTFYKFEDLKHCYAETICLICFKLTGYNKHIISNLNINFLRNQIKSYSNINIPNIVP